MLPGGQIVEDANVTCKTSAQIDAACFKFHEKPCDKQECSKVKMSRTVHVVGLTLGREKRVNREAYVHSICNR